MKVFTDEFLAFARDVTAWYEARTDWSIQDAIDHILEEVHEVNADVRDNEMDHAKHELADVITAVFATYHRMHATDSDIERAMNDVIEKLRRRMTS